ncbi:hypothetical protein HBI23_246300 [Parastagonospora nodorum]|nr:hypothetical protein HBI79_234310 [Parastagonospora nodorum]KAH5241287.1 hypothetical protein HBI71_209010 [Parastagonospora nodorum]KAH5291323.1 hypothetical protein HBI12_241610 [Parastagonospora nodorum]KAH5400857.1 hypothetical protein HBI47_197380 [Parastagonospora nodorum]KAH5618815.1 hypothetical protein HBI23_246300 [Parastagonospora nodorum]
MDRHNMGYIGPSLDPPPVRPAMDPTDVGLIQSSVRSTLANQMRLFLRMIARAGETFRH